MACFLFDLHDLLRRHRRYKICKPWISSSDTPPSSSSCWHSPPGGSLKLGAGLPVRRQVLQHCPSWEIFIRSVLFWAYTELYANDMLDASKRCSRPVPEMGRRIWVPSSAVTVHMYLCPLTTGSPLFSLMLGTQPAVILSSDTAVKDLLDKKGNIYSDRPDMFM